MYFKKIPECMSMYTLFLLEGQKGEAWDPSKKHFCSGNEVALDRKLLSLSC